jgi:hypothetical protein
VSVESITVWLTANQLLVLSVLIPAISALVAALASWIATRRTLLSEKQRQAHEAVTQISVFRRNWINEFRETLAEFQSVAMDPSSTPATEREFYRLGTKIELLMNPEDADYERLQTLMYHFLDVEEGDIEAKYSANPEFVEISQRILKREWERPKDEIRDPNKFVEVP